MSKAGTSMARGWWSRVDIFLNKSWREKWSFVRGRWRLYKSNLPSPLRLSFGAVWLSRNDHFREPLRRGAFERHELAFVQRFLRPGETVMDIGAHHGLYTLLASRCVRRSGRVYSFEPSGRERRALRLHLLLNFCGNVSVQRVALGREKGRADLYLVQGHERGCNSLRQPKVEGGLRALSVVVETIDEWTAKKRLESVDFIKIDVEGGELDVLKGAAQLLEGRGRPVILAEVQDIRTAPWGYPAKDIISYLDERRYSWFSFLEGGLLAPVNLSATEFDGNFLAVPYERLNEVGELVRSEPLV